jgi:PAS domain S-box-containing protein
MSSFNDGSHLRGELRLNEERFRLLVESVADYAIYMLDVAGMISSWNTGAERLKGYTEEEVIGRHFSIFYPPERLRGGAPQKELETAMREGRFEEEAWRVRKDGSRFWAHVILTAIRDEDGNLLGFGKVTRDFTERHRTEQALRESEERFRLMVANVQDYAIFMIDPEGRVATWNVGAERAKGYRAEEIIGQHISRFFPPEDLVWDKPGRELRIARESGRTEDEGWRVRKDGSRFWASVVITALRDETGRLKGFSKVTRDITARKRAEEERGRLLAELKDAVRAREEFLSIAGHELKTPITSLQLYVQRLLRSVEPPGILEATEAREKLRAIERQAHRLTRLIYSLLDVSRINAGRLELDFQKVDLAAVVRDVCDRFEEESIQAGCQLICELPEGLVGRWDPTRLDQVITNLVANGIKYGAGKPVRLSVTRDEDRVHVTVSDQGIGIREEDLARVFGRFERLVSARNYGGFGLGLWISRQIIEAHRGAIDVQSAPGQGSTFVVSLPLER